MEVMPNGSFGDLMTPRYYFPLLFTNSDFCGIVCLCYHPPHYVWGQKKHGFSSHDSRYGHFQETRFFFLQPLRFMKFNTLFPHLICVFSYLSHVD